MKRRSFITALAATPLIGLAKYFRGERQYDREVEFAMCPEYDGRLNGDYIARTTIHTRGNLFLGSSSAYTKHTSGD